MCVRERLRLREREIDRERLRLREREIEREREREREREVAQKCVNKKLNNLPQIRHSCWRETSLLDCRRKKIILKNDLHQVSNSCVSHLCYNK